MIEIFADPITINCRKVLAGMKLMDVDFKLNFIDYFKGEQKSDAYLKINPNASLPSMRDGEFVLWESNSILQYAADKNGKSQFYPTDLKHRADVNRWLNWESASWFPSCYVFLVENCVKPLLGGAADPAILAGQLDNWHKLAGILDERLSKHEWLTGKSVTIADVAVASAMHLRGWQQLPIEKHKHLARWMTHNVEKLPAWEATSVYEGFTTVKKAA
jgi:glutathione S-transferase